MYKKLLLACLSFAFGLLIFHLSFPIHTENVYNRIDINAQVYHVFAKLEGTYDSSKRTLVDKPYELYLSIEPVSHNKPISVKYIENVSLISETKKCVFSCNTMQLRNVEHSIDPGNVISIPNLNIEYENYILQFNIYDEELKIRYHFVLPFLKNPTHQRTNSFIERLMSVKYRVFDDAVENSQAINGGFQTVC